MLPDGACPYVTGISEALLRSLLRNQIMNKPFRLKTLDLLERRGQLWSIPEGKVLINTINAYSYNQAKQDAAFAEALQQSDVLLADGTSIVLACLLLRAKSRPKHRCTGWDLFRFEMEKLNGNAYSFAAEPPGAPEPAEGSPLHPQAYWQQFHPERKRPKVLFLGSTDRILGLIKDKAAVEFPNLDVVTYSPPFKPEFSDEDNKAMVSFINDEDPDLIWIGMTAPKQEKWAYSHFSELNIHCHVGSIGAVFDFYAGTVQRAPLFMQRYGMEWLYRWSREPRRLFRRYGLGNPLFIWNMLLEAIGQ